MATATTPDSMETGPEEIRATSHNAPGQTRNAPERHSRDTATASGTTVKAARAQRHGQVTGTREVSVSAGTDVQQAQRHNESPTIHSLRNEEHQDHQSTEVRAHAPQWEAAGQAVAHQSLRHAEVAVAVEVTSEAGDNINATKKLMMLRHGLPSTESRRTICLPAFFMR